MAAKFLQVAPSPLVFEWRLCELSEATIQLQASQGARMHNECRIRRLSRLAVGSEALRAS